MENKGSLTKLLAIAGTVLVWLPMVAPLLFGAIRFAMGRRFLFDYLMPAELFPVVAIGGALLLWAALRAQAYRKVIGWGLGIAVGMLIAGIGLAQITGLASGEVEATGLWWGLVLAGLAGYWVALIAVGVGGILLLRDLYGQSHRLAIS